MGILVYTVGISLTRGICAELERAGIATRAFEDVEDFLADARHVPRGVVVIDLARGDAPLTHLAALLRRRAVTAAVGVVPKGDVALATEAMRAGAFDIVSQPIDGRQLAAVVVRAAEVVPDRGPLEQLSDRERDVFAGMVEGLTNKQIGIRLGISHRTVEIHRARIMRKLGASNFAKAISMAFDRPPRSPRSPTRSATRHAAHVEPAEHRS